MPLKQKAKRRGAQPEILTRFEPLLLTSDMVENPSFIMDVVSDIFDTDSSVYEQVSSCLYTFVLSYINETERVAFPDIPGYVKASEDRLTLLLNLFYSILTQMEHGVSPFVVNEKMHWIRFNEKPSVMTTSIGFMSEGEVIDISPLVKGIPRSYAILYKALQIVIQYLQNSEYGQDIWIRKLTQMLVIVSSVGHIYECVLFTDSEKEVKVREFLDEVTSESPEIPLDIKEDLAELFDDIKQGTLPYIRDLTLALSRFNRRVTDGIWSVDNLNYSLNSSGSKIRGNDNIPASGLVYSMIEREIRTSPLDEKFGYQSRYPKSKYPNLVQHVVSTSFVPKTSSRGLRAIHSPDNPTSDRGALIEKPFQALIDSLINDCRKEQSKGRVLARTFSSVTEKTLGFGIVCRDLHSSTDLLSIKACQYVWELAFGKDLSDYLTFIFCGPGYIKYSGKNSRELAGSYTQTRGVRQGIKGVFEAGLSFMHHIAARLLMLKLGLKGKNPADVILILGDDSIGIIMDCIKYNTWYEHYMTGFGFTVHPLSKKGFEVLPGSTNRVCEWSKLIYRNGEIVSRIPLKTFFKSDNLRNRLERILWLTQYGCFSISTKHVENIMATLSMSQEEKQVARKVLTFFGKREIANIPLWDYATLSAEEELNIAFTFCYQALKLSIVKMLLNPRDRLSPTQEQLKRDKFENLIRAPEYLEDFKLFYELNCPEFTSKFQMLVELNGYLEGSIKNLLSEDPLQDFGALLSFSEDQRELLRFTVDVLNNEDFYRVVMNHEEIITTMLNGKKFINSIQPHNIQKVHSGAFHVLSATIESMMVRESNTESSTAA